MWYCSTRLAHMQLACPCLTDLGWLRSLQNPSALVCLSLRGCDGMPGRALGALSQHVGALKALNLSDMPLVGDEAGPLLAALQHLEVREGND